MAKITREQATKWNGQLKGGFRFDVRHYAIWGEKVARRNIELDGGNILQATLEYHEVRDGYRPTGEQQPVLHLQVWQPGHTEGMMVSHGMGASIQIGTKQVKRNWSELCKLSADYGDADKIKALAAENIAALKKQEIA